jgi:hypothetical protein
LFWFVWCDFLLILTALSLVGGPQFLEETKKEKERGKKEKSGIKGGREEDPSE